MKQQTAKDQSQLQGHIIVKGQFDISIVENAEREEHLDSKYQESFE